jgi:hypothetical protein
MATGACGGVSAGMVERSVALARRGVESSTPRRACHVDVVEQLASRSWRHWRRPQSLTARPPPPRPPSLPPRLSFTWPAFNAGRPSVWARPTPGARQTPHRVPAADSARHHGRLRCIWRHKLRATACPRWCRCRGRPRDRSLSASTPSTSFLRRSSAQMLARLRRKVSSARRAAARE